MIARLREDRVLLAASAVLAAVALTVLFASAIIERSPTAVAPADALRPPSPAHWLGTDELGRDMLARIAHGGRQSLAIAVTAVAIAALLGVPLGVLAGYLGGALEVAAMRSLDVLLAIPGVLLAFLLVVLLGPGSASVAVAVGIAGLPAFARLARASTLSVKERRYVDAARAIGCSDGRVITRHILPNVQAPLLVLGTVSMSTSLLTVAALSFLGLGPQPPTPEWGALLASGRAHMRDAPWVMLFPGLAITATVLAITMLGDGLGDALDPLRAGRG